MGKQRDAHGRRKYEGRASEIIPEGICGTYTPRERALSHPEYLALYSALPPLRRPYLRAFCGLGVRDSELYRILPEHVDSDAKVVLVPGTKTEGAHRVLPPNAELMKLLCERADARDPGEPLFEPWTNVRRDLAAACERAGIDRVTPNDLRRSFASWQAEQGVPELVTAALMGHSSSKMVRKVYARIGDQAKRDALAKLPSLAGPAVTEIVTDRSGNSGRSGRRGPRTRRHVRARKQKSPQNEASSGDDVVPRDRIELPTRGFSIPTPVWPRPRNKRGKRLLGGSGAAYVQQIGRKERESG
ncbi:MAG: site-specific integrase [Myxococcales bacterium]|nr:site-specific integrase [Myxococcales bacterium]